MFHVDIDQKSITIRKCIVLLPRPSLPSLWMSVCRRTFYWNKCRYWHSIGLVHGEKTCKHICMFSLHGRHGRCATPLCSTLKTPQVMANHHQLILQYVYMDKKHDFKRKKYISIFFINSYDLVTITFMSKSVRKSTFKAAQPHFWDKQGG